MIIPKDLIQILRSAKFVTALTGAGVSKESGIPTFREAQTGLWARYDPMELATPLAFKKNPKLVWKWYQWRRELISNAEPNPGHYALTELELRVPKFTLITQNIDGFHKQAGSKNIIELHGNINRNKCFDEGIVVDSWKDNDSIPPHCPNCGGLIRPDVVWFGENLPSVVINDAIHAAQTAEVFFSIGTSTLVHPAASLPIYAMNGGAIVVEINPDETPISQKVHYAIREPSGKVLPHLIQQVWNV